MHQLPLREPKERRENVLSPQYSSFTAIPSPVLNGVKRMYGKGHSSGKLAQPAARIVIKPLTWYTILN